MNKTQAQPRPARTIASVAVQLMKKYEDHEADVVVAAVKKEFPKSKFDREQFHYYRSMLKRGMVDNKGRRKHS